MEFEMTKNTDVLAIGNAIVDVIAFADEAFLQKHAVTKGSMNLISEEQASALYRNMGSSTLSSGGSAANTIAGVASLGGTTAFIGKVKQDSFGEHFQHDLRALGVSFSTTAATEGAATAQSLILVTPDGERTMNTYLGASQALNVKDVDEAAIKNSKILYLEGYLWDPAEAKAAFRHAAEIAHRHGTQVALTLSDGFCVDRYREEFLELIRSKTITILFANEHELKSLYTTADYQSAISALESETTADQFIAVITRSAQGAVMLVREGKDAPFKQFSVPAEAVSQVVDTTGAGDLFAAGVLYGLAKGLDKTVCLRLGAIAAAEIISHVGARPQMSLRERAEQTGIKI
jgi:sugar/nucleoside kinase (ribokinase family)